MLQNANSTHPSAIQTGQITGLILAGGRGSRMGTVDKGLQNFRGEPMVQTVLQRLAPQVVQVMINANQNLERYAVFGLPVWPDEKTGFAGPLAGLHAGLCHCDTEYLLSVPCDSPFLPSDLAMRLATALQTEGANLAFAATGKASSLQTHPVFCLLKTALLPQLAAYLDSGGRKVEDWFKSVNSCAVGFDDEAAFANINTLDELQRLQ
jgi:molybdopterin-guanine dinucleotide biosynthesis protein A